MTRYRILCFAVCLVFVIPRIFLNAGGISVDAGLTPAEDRWLFRTQVRTMTMSSQEMSSRIQMYPLVLAYGIHPDFTLMTRLVYIHKTVEKMHSERIQGFADPYILGKIKIYRKNTPAYVIGIAPFLATNLPVGSPDVSPRTWNPEIGISFSLRPRFFSFDLTSSYTANDINKKTASAENDRLSINLAVSAIIPLNPRATMTLSPVLEYSFDQEFSSGHEAGQIQQIFISPGLQFINSSFILEGLYQFPIGAASGMVMSPRSRWIIGLRYMF